MTPATTHALATADETPVHGGADCTAPEVRSRGARMLIAVIHGYQTARAGRPTGCRYLPTCSEFAVEAIDRHGPARGAAMAAGRIARCNPWGGHGVDPVPDRRAP